MVHETTMVDHGIVICLFLYLSSCMAIHSLHHDLHYQAKRARGSVAEFSNVLNRNVDDEVDTAAWWQNAITTSPSSERECMYSDTHHSSIEHNMTHVRVAWRA